MSSAERQTVDTARRQPHEIEVWLGLELALESVQWCTASGPSQTCASGRRLTGEANPCLASWDAPLLPQSPGFLS